MRVSVITNCTARKALAVPRLTQARSMRRGSLASLAKEWKWRLRDAERRVPARELYQGRAFQEATKAARLAKTPLYIVSAGLGLINEAELVPPSSLTVSEDHK